MRDGRRHALQLTARRDHGGGGGGGQVAAPVRQTSVPHSAWPNSSDAKVLRFVSGEPLPRALALKDFGRVRGGKFDLANPPHNSPLFRARLLARAGSGFDVALDPLSDWDLWARATA